MGPGLWIHEQPLVLFGAQFGRRCAVVKLQSGELLMHSTCRVSDALKREVGEIGAMRWILVPNRFHDAFFGGCVASFPEAEICAPRDYRNKRHPDREPTVDLSGEMPAAWSSDLESLHVQGAPRLDETVLYHRPSKSLIFADLAFNIPKPQPFMAALFLRLNGVYGEFRPSRLLRSAIKDKTAFRSSIETMLEWDFDQIVTGHGDMIRSGGRERLREAYASL